MSNKSNSSSSGGITFAGVLTVLFIALKLLGKINWPWLWVLSPIWISLIIQIVIIIAIVLLDK